MCFTITTFRKRKSFNIRRHLGVRFSPTHVLIFFAFCLRLRCALTVVKEKKANRAGTKFDEKQRIQSKRRRRHRRRRRRRLENETDQGSSFRLFFYERKLLRCPRASPTTTTTTTTPTTNTKQRGEKKKTHPYPPTLPPGTFTVPRIFISKSRKGKKIGKTCQLSSSFRVRKKNPHQVTYLLSRARAGGG